jgi:hypothetical protein
LSGALIGSGRSADVFEHGEHEVLRRYRSPRDTAHEVAAIEHARAHGFPAPSARRLSDEEIVMEPRTCFRCRSEKAGRFSTSTRIPTMWCLREPDRL